METLKKLHKAIEIIKGKNLKKKGKNTFSKYDYYTPDQVSELVIGACHEVKLFPKFDLKRNELGIVGTLSIYDIEAKDERGESPVVFEMASDIPSIKATNVSQQLGGAMTYTKRYLFMNAFDIADNNLDFDTTENTKKQEKQKATIDETIKISVTNAVNQCETIKAITHMWNANPDLKKEEFFIKVITDRQKILKQNGITE
jgi:hypothetical protein